MMITEQLTGLELGQVFYRLYIPSLKYFTIEKKIK